MLDYTYLPPESPDARDEAATIEAMHIGYANGWIAPAAPAPARLAAIPSPAVTEVQRLKAVVASLVDERNAANARAEAAELSLRLIEADNRDLADAHYCIAGYKAALALVDEYGRCCAHDASFGNESPSFAAWLAQRVGEAAADVAEAERVRRQKLADQLAAANRQIEQLSLDLSRATGAAGGASARADAAERERDDLRRAYALERQRAEAAEAQLAAVPVDALRGFVRMAGIVEVARDEDEEAQFDALTDRVMAWADPTWQPDVQP